ncbi:Hcp family type VI secretion system effector [Solirubrobacter soli]|uniref:Hcp family type VI secretion system effector n=1 Tax=Solirubrobacter soli TaxID=363832 RepID=UPI000405A365|nr:type VI secretion system tube protein Hcp [Solirubrobacter soli]
MNRARRIALASIASVAAAVAIAPSAFAASDYFLKIGDFNGESVANGMTGAVDVNGFSWSAETPVTLGATGGMSGGKPALNELTIEKNVDAATPYLFGNMTTMKQIPAMELSIRKAGGTTPNAAPYLRYCFSNVYVTSQEQSGQETDDAAGEKVTFRFGAVVQQYQRQALNAAPTTVAAGWSQIAAKPFTDLSSPCSAIK